MLPLDQRAAPAAAVIGRARTGRREERPPAAAGFVPSALEAHRRYDDQFDNVAGVAAEQARRLLDAHFSTIHAEFADG